MELSRRDALAALAGAGIVGGGTAAALSRDGFEDGVTNAGNSVDDDTEDVVEALVATAHVVYPSAVENARSFVETYATTKLARRPEFQSEAVSILERLDAEAEIFFDDSFVSVNGSERETVLRRTGADTADSDPEGTTAERVRYYYVNEVLYALYSSPTGGDLVGIENPQGHPGGTDTYQRGPPE